MSVSHIDGVIIQIDDIGYWSWKIMNDILCYDIIMFLQIIKISDSEEIQKKLDFFSV